MSMSTNLFKPLPSPSLTFDQYLAALEEWASREQLGECVSTLRRFHATGYTVAQAVTWLRYRENVLKEDETEFADEHEERGEGFVA